MSLASSAGTEQHSSDQNGATGLLPWLEPERARHWVVIGPAPEWPEEFTFRLGDRLIVDACVPKHCRETIKSAMIAAIMEIMPPTADRETEASAIAMATDGAIVRAQYGGPDVAVS